jgi:hypothetical protein
MPRFALTAVALAALAVGGCVTTAPAPSATPDAPVPTSSELSARDALVGRWDMERVLDDGTDVTAQANPDGNRFLVLHADGTFEGGGRASDRNSGRWVYREGTRRLGLDSDLGPDNDSIWEVTLRGNRMEWAGVGSDYARRFRITSRRVR